MDIEFNNKDYYIPTYKEFEKEYYNDLSSDRRCEHTMKSNREDLLSQYRVQYSYTAWLEKQLSKFVDMKKREGYRF